MATSAELEALLKKIPDLDPDTRKIQEAEGLGKKPSTDETMKAVWKHRPDLAALKTPPRRGKLTGPAWDDAKKIYDEILAGGRDNVVALVGMLKDVDDGADYRARYTLHALTTYSCRSGQGKQRDMMAAALTSQLGGDRPKPVQAFILQQLQLCADKRVAPEVARLLADDELGAPAAATLLAIGAIEPFRAALPKLEGKAKLAAVQNLAVAGDAASAGAFQAALTDADSDVRLAGAAGLAKLGTASAVGAMIKAAGAKGMWERTKMAQSCLVLAEKLLAADKKDEARRIYTYLRETRQGEGEHHVRDAAANALAAM
jgi:hypothetical protein